MVICSLEFTSQKASKLNILLNKEWPEVGAFEASKFGIQIPCPIAALIDHEVVGGLSFTSYKEPNGDDIVVWVKAVFVVPRYRHRGVATKLIQAAQVSNKPLYALTDIPILYTDIGWRTVKKRQWRLDC